MFEKNIKFFYHNIPSLYSLILNIKTRRFKIFNDNILDTKTNTFLYPHSITEDSKLFSFNPIYNKYWDIKFLELTPTLWDENRFFITGKIANKLIRKAKQLKNYTYNGFYFDKDFLPTTAVFGLLAGKHIQELVEKYNFQSLFIYEPNPEFFAISLYFIDYEKLYEKLNERFFLWVNGRLDYYAIEKFYYERIVTSTFCNLTLTTYNHPLIDDAKRKFNEVKYIKLRGWGTYEDEMEGIKNHFKNINKYPLLDKMNILNIPICIVGSGKSLEKSFEFLRKNKDSMIIVSVGTAIKPLLKEGINSDFHIEQERHAQLPEILKDILPNYNGYFLGASVVREEVFKLAKNPLMFIREGFSLEKFYPKLIGSSPIVGNAGFAFGAYFTKEIYLCGMDLGWVKGERKHASNTFYDGKEEIETGIEVEGNFREFVYSDSLLLSAKKSIEFLIKLFNLKVYNLSDGVKINNTIPLKNKNLPKIDKKKYIKQIVSSFSNKQFETPKIDLNPILNAFSKSIIKEIKDYKELTGLIDFLEDSIKGLKSAESTLLRGSFFHLLNNFYILSHKIDTKEIKKLQKIIKKEIFKFERDFTSYYKHLECH